MRITGTVCQSVSHHRCSHQPSVVSQSLREASGDLWEVSGVPPLQRGSHSDSIVRAMPFEFTSSLTGLPSALTPSGDSCHLAVGSGLKHRKQVSTDLSERDVLSWTVLLFVSGLPKFSSSDRGPRARRATAPHSLAICWLANQRVASTASASLAPFRMPPLSPPGPGRGFEAMGRLPSLLDLPVRPSAPQSAPADRYLKRSGSEAQGPGGWPRDHTIAQFPDKTARSNISDPPQRRPVTGKTSSRQNSERKPKPLQQQDSQQRSPCLGVAPLRSPGRSSLADDSAGRRNPGDSFTGEVCDRCSPVFIQEDSGTSETSNAASPSGESVSGAANLENEALRLAAVLDRGFDVL